MQECHQSLKKILPRTCQPHNFSSVMLAKFHDFLFFYYTVESRFNDLQFNDIPGITINIRFPGKSYSKMYGAEPRFNDIRFNDIPGLTMGILFVWFDRPGESSPEKDCCW